MPTLAVITVSANGKGLVITANDADIAGIPSKVRTIQISNIDFLDLFDNGGQCTTIRLISGDKLDLNPSNVQQIGIVTDLDTATKIEAALMLILGW
jgi:hypothetical protein